MSLHYCHTMLLLYTIWNPDLAFALHSSPLCCVYDKDSTVQKCNKCIVDCNSTLYIIEMINIFACSISRIKHAHFSKFSTHRS